MNNKHTLLCADDFGMSPDINEAILDLASQEKISAVSCMTNYPYWNVGAAKLKQHTQLQVGLHFNLTTPSLPIIIAKAYYRLLNKKSIRDALVDQYTRFIDVFGRAPDFIDGHQHIHQLPVIRDVLLAFYDSTKLHNTTWIRSTRNQQRHLKARIINLLGGRSFDRQLKEKQIPHNADFSGIYNFSDSADYTSHLEGFIENLSEDGLIMCHPGKTGDFREDEYNALLENALQERE